MYIEEGPCIGIVSVRDHESFGGGISKNIFRDIEIDLTIVVEGFSRECFSNRNNSRVLNLRPDFNGSKSSLVGQSKI